MERDDYIISDNFEAFELDSTDLIRNLQILFLALFVLLVIPLLLLVTLPCLFWSQKVMYVYKKITNALFFNAYIRFLFEAYLELSIASILRF